MTAVGRVEPVTLALQVATFSTAGESSRFSSAAIHPTMVTGGIVPTAVIRLSADFHLGVEVWFLYTSLIYICDFTVLDQHPTKPTHFFVYCKRRLIPSLVEVIRNRNVVGFTDSKRETATT